jgi:two-component system osmolarity sensor histidine kinase EnvZ
MLTDRARLNPPGGTTWLIWLVTAAALSLAGAALIARLINRPLKELSFAASRVREGDFEATRWTSTTTGEIREVNIGFNRMAQQLAKIEQDRVVMLAGISHDLRTPLARLRLETEMSVSDSDAREHMAADIEQLDAIIDKFLDYARRTSRAQAGLAGRRGRRLHVYAVKDHEALRVTRGCAPDLCVLADEVELRPRGVQPAGERHALWQEPETGIARSTLRRGRDNWVLLKVRDHGPGACTRRAGQPDQTLFPGDAARTAATGAGLGLAIVDKNGSAHGGTMQLANTSVRWSGGTHQVAARELAGSSGPGAPEVAMAGSRRVGPYQQHHGAGFDRSGPRPRGPFSRLSWPSH